MIDFSQIRRPLRQDIAGRSRDAISRMFRNRHQQWLALESRTHRETALEMIVQPDPVLAAITQVFSGYDDSLVLLGGVGTGKSFIARAVTREHIFLGHAPRLISALDLAATDLDELALPAVLIIDDLGAERSTPTSEELLLRVVDHRWEHEQSTIITSNLEPEAFDLRVGQRVCDRLEGPTIVLDGPSRRRMPLPDFDAAEINGRDLRFDFVEAMRKRVAHDEDLWRSWCDGVITHGLFDLLDDRVQRHEYWHQTALIAIVRNLLGTDADEWAVG